MSELICPLLDEGFPPNHRDPEMQQSGTRTRAEFIAAISTVDEFRARSFL